MAFEELKECLTSETTLAYFTPERKTELVVDRAQEELSAIPAQEDPSFEAFRVVSYMHLEHVLMLKESMHQLKVLPATWGTQRSIIITCLEAHSN